MTNTLRKFFGYGLGIIALLGLMCKIMFKPDPDMPNYLDPLSEFPYWLYILMLILCFLLIPKEDN